MKNITLYKLVPVTEAMINADAKTATTVEIINAKYPGGTNQVEIDRLTYKGKEYIMIDKAI
jgi:hypothetical protein